MAPKTDYLGFTGYAARDHIFRHGQIVYNDGQFAVALGGRVYYCRCLKPDQLVAGKADVEIPPDLLAVADLVEYGGGGVNSVLSARETAPGLPLYYLDGARFDRGLCDHLAARGIEYDALNLGGQPANAAFPAPSKPGDKLILRSPATTVYVPAKNAEAELRRLLDCRAVLANSCRHRWVMSRLAAHAARGRVRLYAVLTPHIPTAFVLGAILPWSEAVIVGLDEVGRVLGCVVRESVEGGVELLRLLFRYAVKGSVFLTMGERGVLVADIESGSIYWVQLRGSAAKAVRAVTTEDPLRSVGVGDSFAAGLFLRAVCGLWPIDGGAPCHPGAVVAAIAGSAVAARKLGLAGSLSMRDFAIEELGTIFAPGQGQAA